MARFVIQMCQQDDLRNITFTKCITPERFKHCTTGVKALAGFNEQTMRYSTPSLSLKTGHALQKLDIKVKRNATENTAEYFSQLCAMEFGDEIAVYV